jgi:hypothetical protein
MTLFVVMASNTLYVVVTIYHKRLRWWVCC